MAHHEIKLHVTPTGEGENTFIVDLPEEKTPAAPKPRPQCCPETPLWWEEMSHGNEHKAGWTGVSNVSIPARMYWLYNPKFCPMCGTKLPDSPPR